MIGLQMLNRILASKDYSIVEENALSKEHFHPYEKEFIFIKDHVAQYGNVPDMETFVTTFPDFPILDVQEKDDFLLSQIKDNNVFNRAAEIIQQGADLLRDDTEAGLEYIRSNLKDIDTDLGTQGVDIVHNSQSRYDAYVKKANGDLLNFCIPTGFRELDNAIQGWSRGEELAVLFARTNQGKSWILTKFMGEAWSSGFNVGFVSPEMSPEKIGYRFDTLTSNLDNTALNWGKPVDGYADHLEKIKENPAKFIVATPKEFSNVITVGKLRAFCEKNDINILAVDGITYLTDERKTRSDNRQAELTHISEDLFALSSELGIPVLVVAQAGRDAVKYNGGTLELEHIRDADGIAYNASKVIAIRQKADEEILELTVKKNRDGAMGGKFSYQWIPNFGRFAYLPSEDDGNEVDREEQMEALSQQFPTKNLEF